MGQLRVLGRVAKNRREEQKYVFIDMGSGKQGILGEQEIKKSLGRGLVFQNMSLSSGKLVGTEGSLNRLPICKLINGIPKYETTTITILEASKDRMLYKVINNKGKISKLWNYEVLEYGRDSCITNAKYCETETTMYIAPIKGKFKQMAERKIDKDKLIDTIIRQRSISSLYNIGKQGNRYIMIKKSKELDDDQRELSGILLNNSLRTLGLSSDYNVYSVMMDSANNTEDMAYFIYDKKEFIGEIYEFKNGTSKEHIKELIEKLKYNDNNRDVKSIKNKVEEAEEEDSTHELDELTERALSSWNQIIATQWNMPEFSESSADGDYALIDKKTKKLIEVTNLMVTCNY